MKYTPGFTDFFISPVTGKFITNTLIPLPEDYILVGDQTGFSIATPDLIDVKLDILSLRALLSTAKFLLQEAKQGLESAQALNLVRNGMISNSNGIIVPTTLTHNYFWIGDVNNYPVETATLPIGILPDLQNEHLWRGNASNRPIEVQTISLSNLPNLSIGNIWRGNGISRPVESNAVSVLESDMSGVLSDIANIFSLIDSVQGIVNGLENTVGKIESGLATAGAFFGFLGIVAVLSGLGSEIKKNRDNITDIKGKISSINTRLDNVYRTLVEILGRLSSVESFTNFLNTRINNLRLNNISVDSDVSIHNFKLVNVANPTTSQDAATKFYVDNAIAGIPGTIIITLDGAVSGTGPSNTTINTTFHWTLNQIAATNPTSGSVALNDNRIIGLADPSLEQDAVNLRTLEDAIDNLDITLEGFVIGGPAVDGVITTTRGPTCLLTNIPAGGDVDMGGFKIKNLVTDDVEENDALNFKFLWDFMHNRVEVDWI